MLSAVLRSHSTPSYCATNNQLDSIQTALVIAAWKTVLQVPETLLSPCSTWFWCFRICSLVVPKRAMAKKLENLLMECYDNKES